MERPRTELYRLDALVEWLRAEVAAGRGEEEYIWQDPVYCMMGRYLADHGSGWGEVAYSELPGYEAIAGAKPWTLGAALGRAERLALPAPAAVAGAVAGVLPVIEIDAQLG
jgi:hypothetical protein